MRYVLTCKWLLSLKSRIIKLQSTDPERTVNKEGLEAKLVFPWKGEIEEIFWVD